MTSSQHNKFLDLDKIKAMSDQELYLAAEKCVESTSMDPNESIFSLEIQRRLGVWSPCISVDLYRDVDAPFNVFARKLGINKQTSYQKMQDELRSIKRRNEFKRQFNSSRSNTTVPLINSVQELAAQDSLSKRPSNSVQELATPDSLSKRSMPEPYAEFKGLRKAIIPIESGHDRMSVYYFEQYFAKRFVEYKLPPTTQVLQLKNGSLSGVRFYLPYLQHLFNSLYTIPFVAMPSSTLGPAAKSGGLRYLIKEAGGSDLSEVLIRAKELGPSHLAEKRHTAKDHRNSMKVSDASKIKGLDLILLDDVCTQGSTMRAGRFLLWQAGANSVTCLALTKTSDGTPCG